MQTFIYFWLYFFLAQFISEVDDDVVFSCYCFKLKKACRTCKPLVFMFCPAIEIPLTRDDDACYFLLQVFLPFLKVLCNINYYFENAQKNMLKIIFIKHIFIYKSLSNTFSGSFSTVVVNTL